VRQGAARALNASLPEFAPLERAQLFVESDMQAPGLYRLAGGRAALLSCPGHGPELPNEDAAALFPLGPRSGVLAVADGVGGRPAGGQAARAALEALGKSLERGVSAGTSVRESVLDGLDAANRAVLALGLGSATTIVVAEIEDGAVRSYHVGDSGLLVVGQRGRVKLQTIFHSPVGYAVEAGILDEREAIRHADRHLISNALGREDMRLDLSSEVRLAPRDTLLLASDGLFDNLRTPEIAERIRRGDLAQSFAQLCADCRRRMESPREGAPSKPDDLTVVAFRLG
jgi:serine/threonine protein phosphatase PrpC